jgi:hypothetical protein
MAIDEGIAGEDWTRFEVEATIAVYFQMLRMQEMGQRPNKAEHNRRLQKLIPARNMHAIEYKHRNISSVLNLYGVQSLVGYKPAHNIQRMLVEAVGKALMLDHDLDKVAVQSVETPAEAPALSDFGEFVVDIPTPKISGKDNRLEVARRLPIKRDYLERESRNRSLGLAGELLILEYETQRLLALGKKDLSNRIEHVSKTQGDGLGYDILSFDCDGKERFIEVKTTAYSAETPFFVSQNEVTFSAGKSNQFRLYRLFGFRNKPKMFCLPGEIASNCDLDPVSFRAMLFGSKNE